MKSFKLFCTWTFVVLAYVTNAQPWTYNFGTGTAAAFTNTAASTTYLPAPPSGTARVRTGTATSAPGTFTLVNPGIALGSGTELQMVSNAGSSSTTKFSVFDYTAGNTGYLKFKIAFNGGTNGAYTCWVGDGANYSDNAAMTNAQVFAGLRWTLGATNTVTYTVSNAAGTFGATGITNSTGLFAQSTANSYSVELYMNNTAASANYSRSSTNYTLAAGTWDLWVDGVLVGDDLVKSGLTAAANFDSFAFNHQTSVTAPGTVYLDDFEYSNSLPAPVACTAPSTQASAVTFPGTTTTSLDVTWDNGDGAGRVVLMNNSNSFIAPSNGSDPTANLAWQGAGQQCVFNGTGAGPITVTGLNPSTTYHFAVYEYCSPSRNYNSSTSTGNPNSQSTAAGAALSVNLLTAFGAQCVGGTYGPNSFNITGTSLSTADVTVTTALGVYTFATDAAGPYSSSLSIAQPGGAFSQDIYVQYSPSSAIASNGNIVVGGGGASSVNVAVSGSGIAAGAATVNTPTSTAITTTSATLGATIASTNCSDVTIRGIEWSATNGFANGAGTQVSESGIFGTGEFTIALTGLQANTTYYWKAFATNSTGTTYTAQQILVTSQEFLAAGDISILGVNSNTPDNFCFVNWVDINPNMVIKFTDNGFNGVAPNSQNTVGNGRSSENFVIWKNNTGSAIAAGTVIKIEGGTTTTGQIVSGALSGITSGDQVFAYQGAATSGTFPDYAANGIASTTFNGSLLYGLNIQGGSGTAAWLVSPAVTSSNTSYLPTELASASAAITIGGTSTGSQYTGTRNALGTIAAYKSLVNNPANWTNATGASLVTLNTTGFTVNPNVATQLAVVAVNGGLDPSQNQAFSVTIEVRDVNGAPGAVGIDTDITLSLATGSGTLSGTLTGTMTAGSSSLVISGILYNTAQSGVTITATASGGQSLTAATSAAFTVQSTATNLVYSGLNTFVYTLNNIPTFSVEARRDDNTVDLNYTGNVTVSLTTGTGAVVGTVTKPCVAGIAVFNDLVFDEAGQKTITAASGILTSAVSELITVSTATITEVLLPQFIQGAQPTNANRIPFAYRVTLGGLRPLSTFRYINSMVLSSDASTNNGAGNPIFVTPSGFVRSEGSSLSTAGSYAEFTTDEDGNYSGWFITEPTGNSTRFNPGADIFPRITLNNGLGGTAAAVRLTTSNSVRVLALGATATDGTALRGESGAQPKNFVFVYNNIEGTGRPLSGTFVEADETANSLANSYSAFYANNVNGIAGAYGMVIPNNLAAGVRRVEARELINGELAGCASTDADGVWPSGANTVNPNTGTSPKIFTNADAPLAPSPEVCDNFIDDDCDGLIDEFCSTLIGNDSPSLSTSMEVAAVNVNFPNCFNVVGDLTGANDSPQSVTFTGSDEWYKFVAQSTGVSITVASSTHNDYIALYEKSGNSYILLDSENASSVASDFERLNYSGLTQGVTYYISVGAVTGIGGTYTICLQNLLPSGCATVQPAGGFNLCSTFKASYRGSSSQGAGYTFTFNGTGGGASGSTSLASASGVISLSAPALALRYGGTYSVRVDMNYALQNSIGTVENISVTGSTSSPGCSNVVMMSQPNVDVKSTQRCSVTTLFRYSYLNAARVNNVPLCGPTSYTWVFKRMDDCATPSPTSIDSILATTPSVYCQLSMLPNLPAATGTWGVKVRPNFSYGSGTFGPERYISVNGTSASGEIIYEDETESVRDAEVESTTIYPNPSNGEVVNIVIADHLEGQLQVRVLDAAGRSVTTRSYGVEGLNTISLVFDEKLSAGVYMIEMTHAGRRQTQRLVVE